MSWREHAACRDKPTSMFVRESMGVDEEAEAKAVCAGCPVRDECLADCLAAPGSGMPGASGAYSLIGVWGGTTYKERQAGPRRLMHGGEAAYRTHGCRCVTCVEGRRRRNAEAKKRQVVYRTGRKPGRSGGNLLDGRMPA